MAGKKTAHGQYGKFFADGGYGTWRRINTDFFYFDFGYTM